MEIKETGDRHALFKYNGKLILRTKRSFGSKSLNGNIPHLIRQQLKLNEDQFADLINCPLALDDYISILKEKKFIEDDK
ncbi:MAG: hypothetical protein BMS9Abin36_1125 [Gammaproteobacteria bacterium]|nr:MAG: hypothetical protein BMS9Abin36_1125 [Gammaproteobacteria bacterium]